MPFATTPNKDFIRKRYDKPIIESFTKEIKDKLTYFGLPGPEILDIKEWKKYISKIIAVERDEINAQILLENIFGLNVKSSDFQLLHGDIDKILISGKDEYGAIINFPFNLANLDYEGGIIYKDLKGKSKRIEAIRSLFERQRGVGKNFILFFTFNSRNKDEKEFNHVLNKIQDLLSKYGISYEQTEDVFEWYRSQRIDFKIKIYVLNIIQDLSVANRFECHPYTPITYLGHSNVRMIHFPFKFEWNPNLQVGMKCLLDIVNTDINEVEANKIVKLKTPTIEVKKKRS
jgi:hypothetical protein